MIPCSLNNGKTIAYSNKMSYKDFANDFKKGIAGDILMFYGAEDYLMEWAVSMLIDRYVDEEWRGLDVKYLEGDQITEVCPTAVRQCLEIILFQLVVGFYSALQLVGIDMNGLFRLCSF